MKSGIFFTILLISISTFAKKYKAIVIPENVVRKASYNRLQQIRFAYIKFLRDIKDEAKFELKEAKRSDYMESFVQVLLIDKVEANQSSERCFFGGWPSKIKNGKCRLPQTQNSCSQNQFQCNPALFGEEQCISTQNGYQDLTTKCASSSKDQVNSIVDGYRENPSKLFSLSKEINEFCEKSSGYDACESLSHRLHELHGKVYDQNTGEENPVYRNTASIDHGQEVLRRCQKVAKKKYKDVYQRGLLNQMVSAESKCELPEIEAAFSRKKTLEKWRVVSRKSTISISPTKRDLKRRFEQS
jgi:hypothetical protein